MNEPFQVHLLSALEWSLTVTCLVHSLYFCCLYVRNTHDLLNRPAVLHAAQNNKPPPTPQLTHCLGTDCYPWFCGSQRKNTVFYWTKQQLSSNERTPCLPLWTVHSLLVFHTPTSIIKQNSNITVGTRDCQCYPPVSLSLRHKTFDCDLSDSRQLTFQSSTPDVYVSWKYWNPSLLLSSLASVLVFSFHTVLSL